MTDNDRDIGAEATDPQHNKKTPRDSCCHSHLPLYVSLAALLMAGYALFITTSKHDNSAMQSQIVELESKVVSINDQLNLLSDEIQSNRENLVQNKLKKALENIREIRNLAEEGAKATISEVEEMLQNLTNIGHQLSSPEKQKTPQANEVIKTMEHETNIDEPRSTTVIDSTTDDSNGQGSEISSGANNDNTSTSSSAKSILSKLLGATSTNNETIAEDTKQPDDSATRRDQPEVNLAPAAAPSEAQAF